MSDPLISTPDGTADMPAVAVANLSAALTPQLDGMRADYFATDKEKRLILGRALVLARQIQISPEMKSELDAACESKDIRCHKDTEVINRVLRYVTGDKQARSNSYASSLKAIPEHINTAEKIVDYIEVEGGLEKLRAFYAACQKAASGSNADGGPRSDQAGDTAIDELLRASHPDTGPALPGEGDDVHAPKAPDLPIVSGEDLQPNLADGDIGHSLAHESDADDQLSPPCQGVADIRRLSIARSTITADTMPKGYFVMVGFAGARDVVYVADDPDLVNATAKFIRDYMAPATRTGVQ